MKTDGKVKGMYRVDNYVHIETPKNKYSMVGKGIVS